MAVPLDGFHIDTGADNHTGFGCNYLQLLPGTLIQLTSHQGWRHFKHCHLKAGLLKLPRCFQSQNAASDNHGLPRALHQSLHLSDIRKPSDCRHLRQLASFHRRNKALASQRVNQLREMQLRSVVKKRLSGIHIHALHPFSKHLAHLIFLIPCSIHHSYLLRLQTCDQGFGQHGTLVGRIGLLGYHNNPPCGIPLPDGFCGIKSGRAVTENQIVAGRVVGEIIYHIVHRHKVLPAHAADRTNLDGGIKNLPANQTFNQLPAALCRRCPRLLGLHQTSELVSELIGTHQIRLRRFEPHPEPVYHLHFQLFQALGDMGYSLAAPAVAAERSRIFSAVGHTEHAQRQIPDRTQRLGNNGGRTKQNSVCKL